MLKKILIPVITLIVGLALGYFGGRMMLERQWQQPMLQLGPDQANRAAANDADPTPKAGTKVATSMPLAVTDRYPESIFSFVMGLHRWTWRVVANAALMRDEYPPFRLDTGPDEPDQNGRHH